MQRVERFPAANTACTSPAHVAGHRRAAGLRALRLIASSVKKEAPTIVTYTVQRGETLWDVAVQHGVSMRTIKELNKLAGTEPVLTEGQKLLVPASGITQVVEGTAEAAVAAAALGTTPARGLWAGSEHVRLGTVPEAKQLYLAQCERASGTNTLLVLYAPWCPHCRTMEDELERLAEGLSHVPNLRVMAVNCDSTEGRMFAREVLGVAYYPAIISFPGHSRTFYKYKGRSRDAESLLRFLNMTCCAKEDQMWGLRAASSEAAAAGGMQAVTQIAPLGWITQRLPSGAPMPLFGALSLVAVLAAAGSVAAQRRSAAATASGGMGAGGPDFVEELDSSLGRMAGLMLRMLQARLALLFGLAEAGQPLADTSGAAAAGAAPAGQAADGGVDEAPVHTLVAPAAVTHVSAVAPVAAEATGAVQPSSVMAAAVVAPAASAGASQPGGGEEAAQAAALAAAAAASASAARELSAEERLRLTRLTDDELIALVTSEADLNKVLSKLLDEKQ